MHSEPFTAVARVDSGIESFDDFAGKRVNIGNPGSGQRATMEVVMRAKGWAPEDFELANELPASEQSLALCHNRVQALVYTVGHPNPSINKATGLCEARIVPVEGPAIEALLADAPYYAPAEIPGGIYSGNPEPVPTFGVKATVISSAEVSPDLVHTVVKAVFDDLDAFRAIHPAWGGLTAGQMMSEGLSAPLHEGAVRYYREGADAGGGRAGAGCTGGRGGGSGRRGAGAGGKGRGKLSSSAASRAGAVLRGYIVGTYDKDAGTNNQLLCLNGARVAQMSDTLPVHLNSASPGVAGM